MTELIFTPTRESLLYNLWPNGVTGEIIHENAFNVHLRVNLRDHCEKDPHTAVIVAEWDHVKGVE